MTCAVLTIGTEITRGELVNGNSAWLSERLTELGFEVTEHVSVDDDRDRIVEALRGLSARARIVMTTGGLGPTTDDMTTECVASMLGVPLERDGASLAAIQARFDRLRRTMSPSNAKQADFPKGATVLPNPIGTAPGFSVRIGGALAFFMPGVPREMQKMFVEHVVSAVKPLAPDDRHQIKLRTFGLPESVVGEKLAGVEADHPGVILGYRAHFPEIEVKVLAVSRDRVAARELCERAAQLVRERLGTFVFGEGDESFPEVVTAALRARGKTLAVAESCTGGLLGHLLTRAPGASAFLLLDAVTYSNAAKSSILGIDAAVIEANGAVSEMVCRAMAENVRARSGADIGVAITGIAGPTGGSEAKPVGTVFLALASAKGTRVVDRRLPGERHHIQMISAYGALRLILDEIMQGTP
jgi:nicotinamide-nucleotide amidase